MSVTHQSCKLGSQGIWQRAGASIQTVDEDVNEISLGGGLQGILGEEGDFVAN